jgi:hypothetical protein
VSLRPRKLPLKSEPTITADVVRGTVVDVGTAAGEIEEGAFDVGVCRRCRVAFATPLQISQSK